VNISTNRACCYAAALALPVILAVLGTAVWAQTEGPVQNSATFICRPALADESATAKMVAASTSLVCRPFAVRVHMSDGTMKTIGSVTTKAMPGPDFSSALTPQQVNAAYLRWVEKALDIDPQTAHSS
jgi:hypothetical protein